LEWLQQGCDSDLSVDFLNFGVSNFPFKSSFKKCFKIAFFFLLWRQDPSGFLPAIPAVVVYKKASPWKTFFCKSFLCVKDFV